MRKPEELEVVCQRHAFVEGVENVAQWFDFLHGTDGKAGDALQGHLDDDSECAEADAGRRQQLGVVVFIDVQHLPVARDQGEADDLGGQTAE